MFGTLFFWFIWALGFAVFTGVAAFAIYIAIDAERRTKFIQLYRLSLNMAQSMNRKPPPASTPSTNRSTCPGRPAMYMKPPQTTAAAVDEKKDA